MPAKQPPLRGGWKHIEVNIQLAQKYLEEYKALAKAKNISWSEFICLSLGEGARFMERWINEERGKIIAARPSENLSLEFPAAQTQDTEFFPPKCARCLLGRN